MNVKGGLSMRVHVFIDAENVGRKVAIEAIKEVQKMNRFVVVSVFAKKIVPFTEDEIDINSITFDYVNCFVGKNSADTFMTTSIIANAYEHPLTDKFVILSKDRDFAPVIKHLTSIKKHVIVMEKQDFLTETLQKLDIDMNYFSFRFLENIEIVKQEQKYIKITFDKCNRKYIKVNKEYTTIFLKVKKCLLEVPFYNGINLNEFINLTQFEKYKPKKIRPSVIFRAQGFVVINNRVYFDTNFLDSEEEIVEDD